MNRSILIVICDFLLVSLLAFSTVDINKVSDQSSVRAINLNVATNQVDNRNDLAAVMRLALNEERKNRDQLLGELTRTREAAGQQQTLLTEREKQFQLIQQQLQAREQESQKLQQQQSSLQQELTASQTNILALSQQLQNSVSDVVLSKEKLAAMEAEMKKQLDQAGSLQQQLAQLAKTNQAVLAEKQQLASQLLVAETEKRAATAQVARMQDEVKAEREEKAKLAEGVKALASNSGELAKEVRENRPLASNTIFNDFLTNRVEARFDGVRAGLTGSEKRKDTETVLISGGSNIFALCHVQDTPVTLWNPGADWEYLSGTLSRNTATVPINSMCFHLRDPRVILMPVNPAQARQLGCKVYRIATEPYKFQDAVLVGARDGYYGECKFEIDLTTPDYVKLDRSVIKGLFGRFNPSRGDLVFSRNGELLGIMANASYCMMMRSFDAGATFQFGPDVHQQHTGGTLSLLYSQVAQLPFKLQ